MIRPAEFYSALLNAEVSYFTGVPDSLLKSICAYITEHAKPEQHVIAANEGGAMALAVGSYLATGNVPLVYMQNSGLGNIINPLLSLVDPEVYAVPMLLMIGWRGEPDVKDEPQHVKQGKITEELLSAMSVPYYIIDADTVDIDQLLAKATEKARSLSGAVAILVRKGCFEPYSLKAQEDVDFGLSREEAIASIIAELENDDIVVATTGMASRELFELRASSEKGHQRDFLTVGGMGHASQIALGIAAQKTNRRVICIDGDGAALMHLGSLAISGMSQLENFHHVILNNGAHDSVGGQPTLGFNVNLPAVAEALGYRLIDHNSADITLTERVTLFINSKGPVLLEVKINKGSRPDLGRPTLSPQQNKESFMEFLSK